MEADATPRVLVLASTRSYRSEDFLAAAERLGVPARLGTDRCEELAQLWDASAFGGTLPVNFRDAEAAAARIVAAARGERYRAIIATDDVTAEIAALAAAALGLRGNTPAAARCARNKRLLREALHGAGVACPRHLIFEEDTPGAWVAEAVKTQLGFPVVIKPLLCAGSQGVMRADDAPELAAAWARLRRMLAQPALRAVEDPDGHRLLIEAFVPGPEVALEALLAGGTLTPLCLFDKPDPLDGPFFEETIYVTPSRHPPEAQRAIVDAVAAAARAIGLSEGPVHAEVRLGPRGADGVWRPMVIEVAARSIGGLCARALRFGLGAQSLEELVLRQACGEVVAAPTLAGAAGVMMIPIPRGGVFAEAHGVEAARAVADIVDVTISARHGQVLVALPEGNAYLGFIFARSETPAQAEAALRQAHAALRFTIQPTL